MAMIVCLQCKGICHYTKEGWWQCKNGHGQKIEAAVPTEQEVFKQEMERHCDHRGFCVC